MRQIKFRAWHIKDKCYCESVSCGAMSIVGYDIHEIFNNDIILEQFTGLCDKDGKEIYEGDIVDFKYTHDVARSYNREYRAVVEYDTCNPCFVLKEITTNKFPHIEYDWVICGLVTLEIIGNIHEGKE